MMEAKKYAWRQKLAIETPEKGGLNTPYIFNNSPIEFIAPENPYIAEISLIQLPDPDFIILLAGC